MGIILKDHLLNNGYNVAVGVRQTYILLCCASSKDKSEEGTYFINLIQANSSDEREKATVKNNIKKLSDANAYFETYIKLLAAEGFGLPHTGSEKSQNNIPSNNPGWNASNSQNLRNNTQNNNDIDLFNDEDFEVDAEYSNEEET